MARVAAIGFLSVFVLTSSIVPAQMPSDRKPPVVARPLTARRVARTPEQIARGRYLVENVAHCFLCHSETEWTRDAPGQPKQGLRGGGRTWEDFTDAPFLVSPNITPDPETGAGTWTDDMFARAIREGIGHDGRELFFMPWPFFRAMSDQDLDAVISYVRTIPPVKKSRPKMNLPPGMPILPQPTPLTAPVPAPDLTNDIERGRYLAQIGQCAGCHSPLGEDGEPVPDKMFGGGTHLQGAWGDVTTPNITQDPSGISYYNEDLFVRVIRTGKVVARELNTVMPWGYFSRMDEQDLRAIFRFLKTVPPVKHRVNNTDPPTFCIVCKGKHGLGEFNKPN